jgi:uncharacterized protein YidB (DUF937 family)
VGCATLLNTAIEPRAIYYVLVDGARPAQMRKSSKALNTLSKQTGMSVDDLLAGLSQHLPDLVDQLTPKGRLPSEDEAARMV